MIKRDYDGPVRRLVRHMRRAGVRKHVISDQLGVMTDWDIRQANRRFEDGSKGDQMRDFVRDVIGSNRRGGPVPMDPRFLTGTV